VRQSVNIELALKSVRQMLIYAGDNPDREGLKETPTRVLRAYDEMFAGYRQDPAAVIKTFEDGTCDEMVVLKNIFFTSVCEHHLLPFTGHASVAYIPNKRIIGISKLARVLHIYAKRLQVQERLTTQITKALDEHLEPLGSACVIQATHFCMVCRGVGQQNSVMVTSSLTGEFRNDPLVRSEFMSLIKL
jgi:GTP cyclohydrolase IA